MRSPRMLVAMLALAVLAACGTDPITAPDAAPGGVRRTVEGDPEETTNSTQSTTSTTLDCAGEVVVRVTESGIVTECVLRGQYGSGNGG
jgi:hypothetical protein